MFKNISLSLSGLVFAILIAVVYFKKKRYNSIENNIYRILIMVTIGLLVLEMSSNIIISYRNLFPLITELLCRLFILTSAAWFVFLIAYMEALLDPGKYKNIRDVFSKKTMSFFLITVFILYVISCFSPLTYTSDKHSEFNLIGGDAVFVLYVVFIIAMFLITRVLLKNLERSILIKRMPIVFYLLMLGIIKLFQYFYTNLSDFGFMCSVCIVAMYFTIENQDLKLVSELEVARKNAEDADKSKTEFLSKMSHEIRTPMNVILGFSENLVNTDVLTEEETKRDVKNIYSAGKSLLELVDNILLFSRIESEKEKIENLEYEITNIASELYGFANSKIDNPDLKFEINIDKNIPLKYVGDKAKIYRILVNLIDNAISFTSNGVVEVNIKCDIDNSIGKLKFEIKDTGIGMKKEYVNILKDELSKLDEKKFNTRDTGLGLLLVKRLTNMLDAKITIDSNYGIGSLVTVVIPQQIIGDEKTENININHSEISKDDTFFFDCSKYKILVIDDNVLNIKVMKKLLKPYNIKMEFLSSGKECINIIQQGKKYDLILLDHMMPEMDGIDTIRMLKKMNPRYLPPIVVMTANIISELKEVYKKEGFDDYLSKPINIKDLHELMIKYFKI